MSNKVETVLVVREDHPEGKILINKCDMKPSDVEFDKEPKPAPKKRVTTSRKVTK